jgi:ornithine decarboxylase
MWTYTIDDSLYGQFSSILFDHASPTWVRIRESGAAPRKHGAGVVFGRTCDSVDVIAKAEYMEELEVDDWLWFPNMGAYTRATASEFNGFPRPEVFIDDRIADLRSNAFHTQVPKGIRLMPPVTSRGFWS